MEEIRTKYLIIGGGAAGLTVASHLSRMVSPHEITLLEPSTTHYYQPLFTLVGGGVSSLSRTHRQTARFIPKKVHWIKQKAERIFPEMNLVETMTGSIHYENLIVCPGIKIDWDAIPGLTESLASNRVCSNYSEQYVENTWKSIRQFQGGNAIFTFPNTPVKCAGAPQKIMYIAEDYFRRKGQRGSAEIYFITPGEKIFAVKKYADALSAIIEARQIKVLFKHELMAIDGVRRVAIIRNHTTGSNLELPFSLLHVTPPMKAPSFIAESGLGNAQGWLDVDKYTLRHTRYSNIFGLGDASSLPTSKTAAAVRKQAPVLIHNLLGNSPPKRYDGYTSCPLVTGYGKLILAEFDYDGNPKETFPFDQSKERLSMYLLKKYLLPLLYWKGMLRGRA